MAAHSRPQEEAAGKFLAACSSFGALAADFVTEPETFPVFVAWCEAQFKDEKRKIDWSYDRCKDLASGAMALAEAATSSEKLLD